ncbi:MAG: cyclase family protein [Anaerolineaceae bacterium]|nr:cyclase family protein [Anaerolineaceae bacterium]
MIYDISVSIDKSLPIWPEDQPPKILHELDGTIQVTSFQMGAHTGTHIDAPLHFIPGGKAIHEMNLEKMIGLALVINIPHDVKMITAELLCYLNLQEDITRVLFKTKNSELWKDQKELFNQDYVALSGDAAEFLVSHGVDLVGIDYLSIAPFDDIFPAHQILLRNEVVLLEGINLSGVDPGIYELICLPVKISGADGAPARAVLIDGELVSNEKN